MNKVPKYCEGEMYGATKRMEDGRTVKRVYVGGVCRSEEVD